MGLRQMPEHPSQPHTDCLCSQGSSCLLRPQLPLSRAATPCGRKPWLFALLCTLHPWPGRGWHGTTLPVCPVAGSCGSILPHGRMLFSGVSLHTLFSVSKCPAAETRATMEGTRRPEQSSHWPYHATFHLELRPSQVGKGIFKLMRVAAFLPLCLEAALLPSLKPYFSEVWGAFNMIRNTQELGQNHCRW